MSEFIKSSDHTEMESERKDWNSNPSNWDVWQLSILLLDKFDEDLSANEVKEIANIRNAVTNYAEAIVASLDSDRFIPLWTNLVSSIRSMSMGLDADIKQQCDDLIDNCYKEAEVDLTFLKRYFPKIRTLTDEYKVLVRQIKDLLQEMKEHKIPFQEPQSK
ncbi:uncharacterized protein LOC132757550 [Ruditapes philippinarum]|uniref:uncharacterized protein LOC132757550 n=1 Tax=Ruditapes philippinarum TaxID=129788 RepID=UPI00295BDC29|nr:uncharacterized protein LOC132757550 [Ruditapes philippinarum]